MKKWEPWDSLDKEHKKERIILIVIVVVLILFSPVYNYFNERRIESKISEQNSSLIEDVNEVGTEFKNVKNDWEEIQTLIEEIKDNEEFKNVEKEGDSLDTIVEKK